MIAETLSGLREALLVQCTPDELQTAAQLADRPGAGLVVTSRDPQIACLVADTVSDPSVSLVDASRYVGAGRALASAPFTDSWLSLQRDLGLPVLTDSGYVDRGDYAGLTSVLERTAQLGSDVVATLPLNPWWLDHAGGLDFLLKQLSRIGVPVAIALEHRNDPLSVRKTLYGLVSVLRVGIPVIQLRCDVSGLGLLCHGALAVAVGTRTSLRHFYPVSHNSGRPRSPKIATVVKECLSYIAVNRIALAVQTNPDDSLWLECECSACGYQALDWISTLTEEKAQETAAFTHALEMLFDLRDGLLVGSTSATDRQLSWRAQCENAIFRFQDVETGAEPWTAPALLQHWHKLPLPTSTVTV